MKTIIKAAEAAAGILDEAELERINRFSRKELKAEEVYAFAVRLCDNHTDRDGEFFDQKGLEKLAELFVGKTGIFDHSWSAGQQTARIYRTEVAEEPGVVTEAGEPGRWLKGFAYMLRTPETEEVIHRIEGGILKEVSVSCAVSRQLCSVCGCDIHDRSKCRHIKGHVYEGKRCIVRLDGPTDAYEWSFVAVPAQKEAGVVRKSYEGSLRKALAELGEGPWREELRALEAQAEAGRAWLEKLREETVRLGLLAEPALDGDTLRGIAGKLEGAELEALRKCFARGAERSVGLPVQLRYGREETEGTVEGDGAFAI